ncbi:MAG: DUF1127 domain-containing protein [Octadecabacter sp.]
MTTSINVKSRTSTGGVSAQHVSILAVLAIWKERRVLGRMDENRLRDLGLSTTEAATEAARPFWDLPKCPR